MSLRALAHKHGLQVASSSPGKRARAEAGYVVEVKDSRGEWTTEGLGDPDANWFGSRARAAAAAKALATTVKGEFRVRAALHRPNARALSLDRAQVNARRKRSYRISSQNGEIGTYKARSARDALDVMARDAGNDDFAAACEVTGDDPSDWTESRSAFRRGTISLLVEESG